MKSKGMQSIKEECVCVCVYTRVCVHLGVLDGLGFIMQFYSRLGRMKREMVLGQSVFKMK